MPHQYANFSHLKAQTIVECGKTLLPIKDDDGIVVGNLIPVGNWVFDKEQAVYDMVNWRNAEARSYSDYTPVDFPSTINYLRSWIEDDKRCLFFVHTRDNIFIAHIGVMIHEEGYASIENLRRGISAPGSENLVFLTEKCVVSWMFEKFGVDEMRLETISYNVPLIALHESVGFHITQTRPLEENGKTIYRRGRIVENAHTKFRYVDMKMLKPNQL